MAMIFQHFSSTCLFLMLAQFFFLFLISSSSSSSIIDDYIEWREVTHPSQILLYKLEPAGLEGFEILYLCRGLHEGFWIPGKLLIRSNMVRCVVPYNGREHSKNQFQVLTSPPGTLSWVPLPKIENENENDDQVTRFLENAVLAEIRGFPAYVCRTKFEWYGQHYVMVGKFVKEMGLTCYFPWNREYSLDYNIELLVVNPYGQAINAQQLV